MDKEYQTKLRDKLNNDLRIQKELLALPQNKNKRAIEWTIDAIEKEIEDAEKGKHDTQRFERYKQIIKERGEEGSLPDYKKGTRLSNLPDPK